MLVVREKELKSWLWERHQEFAADLRESRTAYPNKALIRVRFYRGSVN